MRDHLLENIPGDIKRRVSTRSQVSNFCGVTAFVSQIEPKNIKEAIIDECWTRWCMLRHPTKFYGFFERKSRKGWDGPFMIKKVRPNREIVI
jgi:hypothetical protein